MTRIRGHELHEGIIDAMRYALCAMRGFGR